MSEELSDLNEKNMMDQLIELGEDQGYIDIDDME